MAIAVNRQDAISCLRIAVFRPSYAPGVDKINTLNSSVIGDVGMTETDHISMRIGPAS
jgi:hypothetical protein